jgi:N-acetylglutamate synthase-like GNAT family acetyltransferase
MRSLRVTEYAPAHQQGIDAMMDSISKEYDQPISGPQSVKLLEAYQQPGCRFWVALDGEQVVGTVGLILLEGSNAVLKRMMVDKDCRGTGLAARLLETAAQWGSSCGVESIYLGTMAQFTAAQAFYSKLGCVEVALSELPSDMVVNPIDTLHYRLVLQPRGR